MTSTPRHQYVPVFVVLRIDAYLLPECDLDSALRAVEVLPTFAEATEECERLNASADSTKIRYLVSASHWYPDGRHQAAPK